MNAHRVESVSSVRMVRQADEWARSHAREIARGLELTV
jgi:hypothetical protein